MAKAVRRCFKKQGANWVVGKMCNPLGARKKYASGKPSKKPPLKKSVFGRKKAGLRPKKKPPLRASAMSKKKPKKK